MDEHPIMCRNQRCGKCFVHNTATIVVKHALLDGRTRVFAIVPAPKVLIWGAEPEPAGFGFARVRASADARTRSPTSGCSRHLALAAEVRADLTNYGCLPRS